MIEEEGNEYASLVAKFEDCLDEAYRNEIQHAVDTKEFPAVQVSFDDINHYDADLAKYLLEHPTLALQAAEEAAKRVLSPVGATSDSLALEPGVRIRIADAPSDAEVSIREVRPRHFGKLLSVRGIVSVASEVRPRITVAAFQCLRCNTILKEAAEVDHIREPLECYEEQGGCKRSAAATKFRLEGDLCQRVSNQVLEVQEMPEDANRIPERLRVIFEGDDLVGKVRPGDRILETGILRSLVKMRQGRLRDSVEDPYLDGCATKPLEFMPEERELTAEDIAAVQELAARPDVFDLLRDSIAPTIIGYPVEKLALVLQQFGGVAKDLPDGRRIRGDIHCLLAGDPGTVKSGFLMAAANFALRGRTVTASSASAVGLTGTAEQQKWQGVARWFAKAGLMPLSDRAFLAIDEFDKMSEEDRGRIHEALDPQVFTIAKASVVLTLWSRCAVLAACNPKTGRFDENKYIFEQLNLPGTLLSRFDAIFVVVDVPDKQHDMDLATQLLRVHQAWDNPESDVIKPKIPVEVVHNYLAYAKRIKPRLSDEVLTMIRDYYVDLRKAGTSEGTVAATPRQLESLVRFAEASARVRLSAVVDEVDAKRAMAIYDYWTMKVLRDEMGRFDVDIVTTGTSTSQREQYLVVINILRDLQDAHGEADYEDIVRIAQEKGLRPDRVDAWLKKLNQEGEIFEASKGRYKLEERM